jgi:pimeloyl-ACP methyl ester carboxylesterase
LADQLEPSSFAVQSQGLALAGERVGEGPAVVLAHGLTATRRYVLHGSKALPRRGYRLGIYDARGHGESDPGPTGSYSYDVMSQDLEAVLDAEVGSGRVVLGGHSMGAQAATAYTLRDQQRVAALVVIGPVSVGAPYPEEVLAEWDRLADGLENDGVEGFLAAYDHDLDPQWRETLLRITRERLEEHRHPEAVAQALREVPRSMPFDGLAELELLDLPVLVVASHDEADSGHPYAVAEAWAERIPGARFVTEEPGESPLAWQGGRLSREIAEFCDSPDVVRRLEA